MFYGLTQRDEDFYAANMNKFIALAPCIYLEDSLTYDWYVNGYQKFRDLGVYVFFGPNWEKHTKTICENMTKGWCDFAKNSKHMEPEPLKTREWYT